MSQGFRDNYLLFQLAVVSYHFSEDFHRELKRYDISPAKWRILVNVEAQPGIGINDLSAVTLLEQSHTTKLTDQLCQEKLLEKKTQPADRRRVGVWISERGRNFLMPLIEFAKEHEVRMLGQLPEEERVKFKEILAHLVAPYVPRDNHQRSKGQHISGR